MAVEGGDCDCVCGRDAHSLREEFLDFQTTSLEVEEELQEINDTLESDVVRLTQENEKLERKNLALMSTLEKLQSRERVVGNSNVGLMDKNKKLQQDFKKQKESCRKLEQLNDDLTKSQRILEEKLKVVERRYNECLEQKSFADTANEELVDQNQKLQRDFKDLQERFDDLSKAEQVAKERLHLREKEIEKRLSQISLTSHSLSIDESSQNLSHTHSKLNHTNSSEHQNDEKFDATKSTENLGIKQHLKSSYRSQEAVVAHVKRKRDPVTFSVEQHQRTIFNGFQNAFVQTDPYLTNRLTKQRRVSTSENRPPTQTTLNKQSTETTQTKHTQNETCTLSRFLKASQHSPNLRQQKRVKRTLEEISTNRVTKAHDSPSNGIPQKSQKSPKHSAVPRMNKKKI